MATSGPNIAHTGVAAACMAHGLIAPEAEEVWRILGDEPVPWTFAGVFVKLEDAIEQVKAKRAKS